MWKEMDTVVYCVPKAFNFSSTLAIFNFSGTLVKKVNSTKMKKFLAQRGIPEGGEDKSEGKGEKRPGKKVIDILSCMYPSVKEKLLGIYKEGASIIIYQSFNSRHIDDIKILIEEFRKLLRIPIAIFLSTSRNKYSKPFTGMWDLIELLYARNKKTIDKKT